VTHRQKSRVTNLYFAMGCSERFRSVGVVAGGKNGYTGAFARKGKRQPPQVLTREGIRAVFLTTAF
jgi:hypothetical protein